MFILRTINDNGVEFNQILGESYTIVDRFISYEVFQIFFKDVFMRDHVADLDPSATSTTKQCFAFIWAGDQKIPLYFDQSVYVMTDTGRTFKKLTYASVGVINSGDADSVKPLPIY